MDDIISHTEAQPKPKKSPVVVRCLRIVRKSLEEDGIVGCVTESSAYSILRNLRLIWWFVLAQVLWGVERYAGHYLMNPEERMKWDMNRIFSEYGSEEQEEFLGPLGKVLESKVVVYFEYVVIYWVLFDLFLSLLYMTVKRFTPEENDGMQQEFDEEKKLLGHEKTGKKGVLDRLVRSRLFRYCVIAYMLVTVLGLGIERFVDLDALDSALESAQNRAREHESGFDMSKVDLSHVNPYRRDFPADQDGVLREGKRTKVYLHRLFTNSLRSFT